MAAPPIPDLTLTDTTTQTADLRDMFGGINLAANFQPLGKRGIDMTALLQLLPVIAVGVLIFTMRGK